jgi:hypothetical protein
VPISWTPKLCRLGHTQINPLRRHLAAWDLTRPYRIFAEPHTERGLSYILCAGPGYRSTGRQVILADLISEKNQIRPAAVLHLIVSGRITGDEYDKKARELKERQTEITLRIEQHQKGEGDFRATLETLISAASRAAELFDR